MKLPIRLCTHTCKQNIDKQNIDTRTHAGMECGLVCSRDTDNIRSRRQDDWETYEREKETTADEQHMRGILNSKETS